MKTIINDKKILLGACGGIADDALSTFMLAVPAPVMLCPAMNTPMYESRAVQRNLDTLRSDGYFVLDPGSGQLACGATGTGRLPEPEDILDRFIYFLSPKDLNGKKLLVTAGPAIESIDPVRFISNPSSGQMGYAAETEDFEKDATQKLAEKNLDIIAGNLVGDPGSGFGSDTNSVTFLYKDGNKESLPTMDEDDVAHIFLDRIIERVMNEKPDRP